MRVCDGGQEAGAWGGVGWGGRRSDDIRVLRMDITIVWTKNFRETTIGHAIHRTVSGVYEDTRRSHSVSIPWVYGVFF